MSDLSNLVLKYRNALKNDAHHEAQALVGELTGITAKALQQQDTDIMKKLDATFSDLAPFVNRYGSEGAGERWRTLGEILDALLESARPLNQRRLADPTKLTGRMLRRIHRESGIRPGRLASELKVSLTQISNKNLKLERAGLIHRLKRGRETNLYLSGSGQELMERLSPVHSVSRTTKDINRSGKNFPHVDPIRSTVPFSVSDFGRTTDIST